MNETLEMIDDSALDQVAGGLSLGLNLESSLLSASVSANTSCGINLSACLKVPCLLSLNLGASVG